MERIQDQSDQVVIIFNFDEFVDIDFFICRFSYIFKFIKVKFIKCFDKKLKILEEFCDIEYFIQILVQFSYIEYMFRGDLCYFLISQIDRVLLK